MKCAEPAGWRYIETPIPTFIWGGSIGRPCGVRVNKASLRGPSGTMSATCYVISKSKPRRTPPKPQNPEEV